MMCPTATCQPSACLQCGRRAGWIAIWVNVGLGLMKVSVGVAAGSHACVADALASALNVFSATSIFISRKLTHKPVDERHPYGYGKVEFIAAGAVALIIVFLTMAMVVNSLVHIIYKPQAPPYLVAGLAAVISVVTNEMLFRFFRCVGTELRSQTILANAWSNRGEALGSVAVVVGVIGAQFGFNHLDPLASLVVSAIILKYSIGIIRDSVRGLMDQSLPTAALDDLKKLVMGVGEVAGIRQLRARQLGDKIWVDLVVETDRSRTVRQCDEIRARIQKAVREAVENVSQILVDFEMGG